MSRHVTRSITHLQVENGEIVLLAKNRKAKGQEAGVSGQTDEGGGNGWRTARVHDGTAIDAVGQPIPADVGVEKRVSLDLWESVNEPQAQRSTRREREERGKHCAPAEGGHPEKSYKGLRRRALGLE